MRTLFLNHSVCPKSEMSFFYVKLTSGVIGGGIINLDFLKLNSSSNKSLKKTEEKFNSKFSYAAFETDVTKVVNKLVLTELQLLKYYYYYYYVRKPNFKARYSSKSE